MNCSFKAANLRDRTEVFGGDGLESDDLQSAGAQDQLAAPGVEVLQRQQKLDVQVKNKAESRNVTGPLLTFRRSDRRVSMSVAMGGMSLTH